MFLEDQLTILQRHIFIYLFWIRMLLETNHDLAHELRHFLLYFYLQKEMYSI